jgi:multiple antibiotic resistance protein
MNDLFGFALLSFTSFFTLINPLGTMPVFMTMTANIDQEH